MEAEGGSGALSEIPADDDHMSAAWGWGQSCGSLPPVRSLLSSVVSSCPGLGERLPQQTGLSLCSAHSVSSSCKREPVLGTGWAHLRETRNERTDGVEGREPGLEGY